MIASQSIHVQVVATPLGDLLLHGFMDEGYKVPLDSLKKVLFAWHSSSLYGMFVEIREWEGLTGLFLPASMALDYLAAPSPLLHAQIVWSEDLLLLQKAALLYKDVLKYGWFVPSYADWQQGRQGWRLLLPEEQQIQYQELLGAMKHGSLTNLEAWFNRIVEDMISKGPNLTAAWERLNVEQPLFRSEPEAALADSSWMDEEDWLIAIGWRRDEAPFRICLQLLEPQENSSWHLQLIVQDSSDTNLMAEFHTDGQWIAGEIPAHWTKYLDSRIRKTLDRCLRVAPYLRSSEDAGRLIGELSDEEAWRFMDEASLLLIHAGISVFLPSWWEQLRLLKPQLKAKLQSSVGSSKNNAMFGMDQLMQYDWKIAVGKAELTEDEFIQMAEQKKRLMHIRGNWIQLDPSYVEKIEAAMRLMKKKGLSLRDVLEQHLLETEAEMDPLDSDARLPFHVELTSSLRNMMKQLHQTKTIPIVAPPGGLIAELRHYQLEGVSWLLFLRQLGFGGCLADDMGLGKTIQFIAYLLTIRGEAQGPSMLICPTSVLGNWQKELERFAPSLRVHLHYGAQRAKGEAFAEVVQGADLVLTSYTLSHLDEEELSSIEWASLCLDEAQNIKNAYTKQASSIRKFRARQRIALTGTPIENRLTELWSIFDFINPGYLGSLGQFSHKYANEIEKSGDPLLTAQVQKLIKPFLLRRVKKDPTIQLDLPDKNEAKTYISLTVEQGVLYENVVQNLMDKIETLSGMEKKGLILATLTKLKQLCNHPALFLKESGTATAAERSNKLTRLLEMIDELRAEGEKCLIFTQFVEMGHILQSVIERERSEPVQFLHGGLTKAKRDEMITQFQESTSPLDKQYGIFLLSLKAGGTGLNLTAANHVFHFDRWWNPAVEDQATDRAFRIGQTRDVQVHKFVTLGTLEERIDEMIERKQGLSRQIVGGGENWITEMSTNELRELFALRREWIGK